MERSVRFSMYCEAVWLERRRREFGAVIILTFAKNRSGLLSASVRVFDNKRSMVTSSPYSTARYVHNIEAFHFLRECRTIYFGLIVDGVSDQIHEAGFGSCSCERKGMIEICRPSSQVVP